MMMSVDVAGGISRSIHFSLIKTLLKYHIASSPGDLAISLLDL
jgi:hypothetical protein